MKHGIGSYLVILAFGSISQITLAAGFTPPLQLLGMEVRDMSALYLRMSADTECGSPPGVVTNALAPKYVFR
jgi:hypothetical protein